MDRVRDLLLGCIGIALVIVLAWTFLKGPVETAPTANPTEKAVEQPPVASAPAPRPPAVALPSLAVPATADRLQQEAEHVATDLSSRFPRLAEALHVAAMMHSQFGRTHEAENLWRKCTELSPRYEGYYVNLAAVSMDRGNSDSAVKTLRRALAVGCSSPDLSHHLAIALTNLGQCEEAMAVIQRVLQANPQFTAGWLILGQAQLQLGKGAEAEASLRRVLALGAPSAEVYFALASACARQGKHEEAAAFRQQYTDLQTNQPLPVQRRFEILTTADARRTAVAVLTEAATVYSWQEDFMEAERLLLRALALDPVNVASCRALATLYQSSGMHAEERVVRRRLIEVDPGNYDNYVNLAKVSARLDEPQAAEAALKLGLAVRPDAPVAYGTLAQFYLQAGQARQARWFAEQAARRRPTAEAYQFLAETCQALGETAAAEEALKLARQLQPQPTKKPDLPDSSVPAN
jgi:tetratricopeptide (TPR) repeat protein